MNDLPIAAAPDSLISRSWALRSAVAQRIADAIAAGGPEGNVRFFAEGLRNINSRLATLERATRSVVYNLQQNVMFDHLRRERELNRNTRQRKIKGHMIAAPSAGLSLVAACHPDTWIAPVHVIGLVIDERLALLPGPLSVRGEPTAWLCDHPDVVAEFCDLWVQAKHVAVPIRDAPGVTRLTDRQLDVVSLLSRGVKDAAVARLLGVSLRTVTSDISKILDALQVSTRWEAGMIIGRVSIPDC